MRFLHRVEGGDFLDKYTRSREDQADYLAEEAINIATKLKGDAK